MTNKKETTLQALGLMARIVLCPITLVFIWSAIAGPPKRNAPGNEGSDPIGRQITSLLISQFKEK